MSADPKFTPGPWGIEDPLGPEVMSIVANPDGETYEWTFVAQVTADDDNTEAQGISFAEAQANARLIAAAPDLYPANAFLSEALSAHEKRIAEFNLNPLSSDDNACITWPNGEQTIIPIAVFLGARTALSQATLSEKVEGNCSPQAEALEVSGRE